jgi:hypothetical protein
MTDDDFRDYCAAAAVTGLIARYPGDEEQLRHHYHVITVEAYRLAEEMVAHRRQRATRQADRD